jgi:hypothetical protein
MPSLICKCGRAKERPEARHCDRCRAESQKRRTERLTVKRQYQAERANYEKVLAELDAAMKPRIDAIREAERTTEEDLKIIIT